MPKNKATSKVSWKGGLSTTPYRGGNYYYHFMFEGEVKEGSTGCQYRKDAEQWLRSYKTQLALKKVDIKKVSSTSFKQVFEEYLVEKKNALSEKYIENISESFAKHVIPYIGQTPIASLTTQTLMEIVNKYIDQGNSKSGANTIISYIRTILNFAKLKEYLVRDVPKLTMFKIQRKKKPVIPFEKLGDFLLSVDSHNRPKISIMVRAMLYLGLREKEARLMKWSNIDWAQKTYTPDKTKNYDTTTLPLPQDLFELLRNRRAKLDLEGNTCEWIIEGRNNSPVAEQYARDILAIAGAACGLTGITNHRLRGTMATLMARKNIHPKVIQQLGRWKNMAMLEIYIEDSFDAMKQAVSIWDDIPAAKS